MPHRLHKNSSSHSPSINSWKWAAENWKRLWDLSTQICIRHQKHFCQKLNQYHEKYIYCFLEAICNHDLGSIITKTTQNVDKSTLNAKSIIAIFFCRNSGWMCHDFWEAHQQHHQRFLNHILWGWVSMKKPLLVGWGGSVNNQQKSVCGENTKYISRDLFSVFFF